MDRKTRMMALLTLSVSLVAGSVAFAAPEQPLGPTEADVVGWVIDTYGGDIEIWFIDLGMEELDEYQGGGGGGPEEPSLGGSGSTDTTSK